VVRLPRSASLPRGGMTAKELCWCRELEREEIGSGGGGDFVVRFPQGRGLNFGKFKAPVWQHLSTRAHSASMMQHSAGAGYKLT